MRITLLLFLATRLEGADRFWNNQFGGAWNAAANWQNGQIAMGTDVAHFGVTTSPLAPASYTVDFDVNPGNFALIIEDDRVTFDLNTRTYTPANTTGQHSQIGTVPGRLGRLTVTDGILNMPMLGGQRQVLDIATVATASGTLTISTGGEVHSDPIINVGAGGVGTLIVENSADALVNATNIGATSAGTATITGGGSTLINSASVVVAQSANGTMTLSQGGVVQNTTGTLGSSSGTTGIVSVSDFNSRWNNSGQLTVGSNGTGQLTLNNGGRVDDSTAIIASEVGSQGTVTVGDVTPTAFISQWVNTSFLTLGSLGNATVNLISNGSLQNTDASIASFVNSTSVVNVSATNAQWLCSGELMVGQGGNGTLHVTAGMVQNAAGTIGDETLSTGSVTVDGVNSLWINTGPLLVADFGHGTLSITNGGVVSTGAPPADAIIGNNNGSHGTVTVTDTGSQWGQSGDLFVGMFGQGDLTIEGGGMVSNLEGKIGVESGPTSMVTVSGAGSRWSNSADLAVGDGGTGVLNITDGGAVSSADTQIGQEPGSTGTVTVSGAGATWTIHAKLGLGGTASDLIPGGAGTLNIQTGGAVNVAQNTVIFPNSIVRLQGGTLDTTAISFQGAGGQFEFLAGTLHVGTYNGNLMNQGGKLAPGHSAGTTTINGSYTQQSAAALEIEVGGVTSPGISYDVVNATGAAALAGQLQVALLNGFVPSGGHRFTVASASSIAGLFSNVANGQRVVIANGGGSFLVHYGLGSAFDTNKIVLSHFQSSNASPRQLIAIWTFEPGTSGNPPSGSGANISGISPAVGSATASGHHASSSTIWSNFNGNGSAESFSADRWAVGDYYQFQTSTVGLDNIQLTLDQASSGTGPRDFKIAFSTNGTSFTDTGLTYAVHVNGSGAPSWGATYAPEYSFSFDLSGITALNNQATLFLRLVVTSNISADGAGTITTGGTSRIDAVAILGASVLPGDFDKNGAVNAADYVQWRKTDGSASSYNVWRTNFGRTSGGSGAGATANASVPEPAALVLLMIAAVGWCLRRGRAV